MENKIAVVGIVIEDVSSSDKVNEQLHEYANYIVGRLGIPYKDRGVNVISIIMDAPSDVISSLSGKLGMIKNVSVKTAITKV